MMQWFVDDTCRRDDARIPIGYRCRQPSRVKSMKLDAPRSPAKLASSSSPAPTFRGTFGRGRIADEEC